MSVTVFERLSQSLLEASTHIAPIHEIPVDVLAYVGDAVFNLHCVLLSVGDGRREVSKASLAASLWKSAESQNRFLSSLIDELTEEERAVVKRGRNSKGAKKRGNDPSYRNSTGFEALIGFLLFTRQDRRLQEILDTLTRFCSESASVP